MNRSRHLLFALLALWVLAWTPMARAAFDLRYPAWDALPGGRSTIRASTGPSSAHRSAARCCATKPMSANDAVRNSTTRCAASCRTAAATRSMQGTEHCRCRSFSAGADFERGHQGIDSLQSLFNRFADALGGTQAARAELRAGRFKLGYLDDDGSLNDAR